MIAIARVNCHLCPLKEFCSYAEIEGSYRRSRLDLWYDKYSHVEDSPPMPAGPTPEMEQRIARATAFCPLRKALEASS